MSTAVVVIGGELGETPVRVPVLDDDAFVVAADSGYHLAMAAGLSVDVLIGDLDSISPEARQHAEAAGVAIESYGSDKDQTDLELALAAADRRTPRRLLALGNAAGRIDHQLAGIAALAAYAAARPGCRVELHSHVGSTWFLLDSVALPLDSGSTVSLVPWNGDATVSISGVRWPLDRATLPAGSGRGVSNEVVTPNGCTVTVAAGLVLVVVPSPATFIAPGDNRANPSFPTPTPKEL